MPAGVFLLGDEEAKGIKSRVKRLIALADGMPAPFRHRVSQMYSLGSD